MLKFKDCQVSISGTPILANNVSITENSALKPIRIMGLIGRNKTTPISDKRNSIEINYVVETNQEPNFYLAKNIRDYNTSSFPVRIIIGGITGDGYLNRYSISIEPNNQIRASVSYDVFGDLKGDLQSQPPSISTGYNKLNSSGIAHYWTTYAKTIDGTSSGDLLQGNYSFNANWNPIYGIGSAAPVDVVLLSSEENYSFISEHNYHVKNSGQPFEEVFEGIEMIEINNQSSEWSSDNNNSLKLYPASGKINSQKINFLEGSPILVETNIVKFY